jgi:hypothetical protein
MSRSATRVGEFTTTTGTGTYNLDGAITDFKGFVDSVGAGAGVPYVVENSDGSTWEVNVGTLTDSAPDTLSRDTLIASSTGSAIDWPDTAQKRIFSAPLGEIIGSLVEGGVDTSAPAWTTTGSDWTDTSVGGGLWDVKKHDGAEWVEICRIDTGAHMATPYYGSALAGTATGKNTGTTNGTVPLIGAGDVISRTILQAMAAASAGANGEAGIVPQPLLGEEGKYLRGDATWAAAAASDASETVKGVIEIALASEVASGLSALLAMTPKRFADNGGSNYITMPGGYTICWGRTVSTVASAGITFPVTFASTPAIITSGDGVDTGYVTSPGTTGFTSNVPGVNNHSWHAIGKV